MKRLYRSRTDKVLAGICGGMGAYTGIDPVVWRVIFIVLMLPGGIPGPLLYGLMWVIIPKEPK